MWSHSKWKWVLKCQEHILNNFMREQDLNQAKSNAGSFLECVWAVSALCSLFAKFNQHKEWTHRREVQTVADTQTHSSSVCAAHSARNCDGAMPAAGGHSERKRHIWKRNGSTVMKIWWVIKVKVTETLLKIYIFSSSFKISLANAAAAVEVIKLVPNALLSRLWFEGSGVSWLNMLSVSINSAEQMLIMALESWGSMTDIYHVHI